LAARDLELGVADEAVAPGLSPRWAAAHFAPVSIVIPDPTLAEGFDVNEEPLVTGGAFARAALRPWRGWIEAAQAGAHVVKGCAIRIEFHVAPGKQPVMAGQKPPIQLRAGTLAAHMGGEQGVFPTTGRRYVRRERHVLGATHIFPASLQLFDRRFLEILGEDDRRVLVDANVARILRCQARAFGRKRLRSSDAQRRWSLPAGVRAVGGQNRVCGENEAEREERTAAQKGDLGIHEHRALDSRATSAIRPEVRFGVGAFIIDASTGLRNVPKPVREPDMQSHFVDVPKTVIRSLGFAVIFLSVVLLAGGCQKSANSPAPAKPKIALVMKSLANEFFSTMAEGARQHQAAHAETYDLIVNGMKNETDLAEQVGLVEQMIARQVNALVIAPADSKALVTVLKRAKEAGVLVVNIDNKLDGDALKDAGLAVPFVGPDNRAGARKVGEALAKQLKPGDRVAIIEGIPTAFNGQQRRLGFEDAMKAAGMEIVSTQSGYWEMDKANNVATAMLSEHPELKAILCANDNMALGAVAAIQAAGKTGRVLAVGFDNIAAVRPMLQDGRLVATADQHADKLAVFGIEAALKILRGEAPPADQTTAVDLVTSHQ
jgi:ribose transport system substrate-binding protein